MIMGFKVSEIHCNSCISNIKMNIEDLDGINEIKGNLETKTITVGACGVRKMCGNQVPDT